VRTVEPISACPLQPIARFDSLTLPAEIHARFEDSGSSLTERVIVALAGFMFKKVDG
jgi:hypothetical protein